MVSLEASSSSEQLQRLEQHALDSNTIPPDDCGAHAELRSVESTLLLSSHSLDLGPASPSKQNQSRVAST